MTSHQAHLLSKDNKMEPKEDRMMQFFSFKHLPDQLQKVSAHFHSLATYICDTIPSNPERTVALRKLLEAKDCAVRSVIYKEPS